jgi:DNA-binding MarR family transcriptional regulator
VSNVSAESGPYVGAMMRLTDEWVRELIFAGVLTAGHNDLNRAHVALFRYESLDGLRPTELADRLRITKQSINDLLGHLEQHGYIVRDHDPTDGRARVIRLTTEGRRLCATVRNHARSAELQIAELLGPRRFTELRATLETLADALRPTPH